jgi:hypothetical protein
VSLRAHRPAHRRFAIPSGEFNDTYKENPRKIAEILWKILVAVAQ